MRKSALLMALTLLLAACFGGDEAPRSEEQNGDDGCVWTIGTMGGGDLELEDLRTGMLQGIRLAVADANEQDTLACRLELQVEDTTPDASDRVPPLTQGAQRMSESDNLVACICPYFAGETLLVGQLLSDSGIPFISADPSNGIPEEHYDDWYRAIPADEVQAPAAGEYLAQGLRPESAAIVHDNQAYSQRLATAVKEALGVVAKGPFVISPEATDYTLVVKQIKNLEADLVYFAGAAREAGHLAAQLRERKVDALFVASDAVKQPEFGEIAQDAAEGAVVTCPCVDPRRIPAADSFVAAMEATYGDPPAAYATEMYDVTSFVARALASAPAGESITDLRIRVADFFFRAQGQTGLARDYTWDSRGELETDPLQDIWVYEWIETEDGFEALGPIEDQM